MASLLSLERLVAPPVLPYGRSGPEAWARLEVFAGGVPDDYRALIAKYGVGFFDEFLCVFFPQCPNPNLDLFVQARRCREALLELRAQFPDDYAMPVFPEQGGWIPVGGTDNGDTLYWVTGGQPNDWTIAVLPARGRDAFFYPHGLVAFLVAVLGREVCCDVFPLDFPSERPLSFRPANFAAPANVL